MPNTVDEAEAAVEAEAMLGINSVAAAAPRLSTVATTVRRGEEVSTTSVSAREDPEISGFILFAPSICAPLTAPIMPNAINPPGITNAAAIAARVNNVFVFDADVSEKESGNISADDT
jgi:hypothetical protein